MARISPGFSALEALIVMALIAVLAGLGYPSLQSSLARARLQAERNALHHALHLARRESVKRNRYVAICKSRDGVVCDPAARWDEGWIVFVDTDRRSPTQRDDDEPLIRYHRPTSGVTILSNRNAYVIRTVRRRTTNGTFSICDDLARVEGLGLVVSHTGRPRSISGTELPASLRCAAS